MDKNPFLTLNPKMSDKDFEKAIDNLNQVGKLTNREFNVSIDNHDLSFKINKIENGIRLTSSKIDEYYVSKMDESLVQMKYGRKGREIVESFRDFFEKKYNNLRSSIINSNIKSQSFKQSYYHSYDTPEKIIIIGYTIIPDHREFLTNISGTKNFGYCLEINYFTHKDFESTIKLFQKKEEAKKNEIDSIERKKNEIKKNNKLNQNDL